jgi:hypothetical protein
MWPETESEMQRGNKSPLQEEQFKDQKVKGIHLFNHKQQQSSQNTNIQCV